MSESVWALLILSLTPSLATFHNRHGESPPQDSVLQAQLHEDHAAVLDSVWDDFKVSFRVVFIS